MGSFRQVSIIRTCRSRSTKPNDVLGKVKWGGGSAQERRESERRCVGIYINDERGRGITFCVQRRGMKVECERGVVEIRI